MKRPRVKMHDVANDGDGTCPINIAPQLISDSKDAEYMHRGA